MVKETISCEVVMLPTKEPTVLFKSNDRLYYYNSLDNPPFPVLKPYTPLHLYLTSNEDIKEGDWYMLTTNCLGEYKISNNWFTCRRNVDRKVVASTDPSLGLLSIPESWIKGVYVPSNGKIGKIMLETYFANPDVIVQHIMGAKPRLKLTANNEVMIVDKPKLPFTQEEEEHIANMGAHSMMCNKDKELEDAAIAYVKSPSGNNYIIETNAFKAGVKWKEKQAATSIADLEKRLFNASKENAKLIGKITELESAKS